MGSQQRNVLLSTKLPIKSRGGYFMKGKTESENHYVKYQNNQNKNIKKGKKKGK